MTQQQDASAPDSSEPDQTAGEKPSDGDGAAGEDKRRFHRRGFFREGFRKLLTPLAEIVEQRVQDAAITRWAEDNHVEPTCGGEYGSSVAPFSAEAFRGRALLRPPGALPEEEFLARCVSSGGCVAACPVSAIRLVVDADPEKNNKPAIDPDSQACVLCEDLACMSACPTGALHPVAREDIDMGLAVVRHDVCVRSQGEDCQICVDKCPLGPLAIDIPEYDGEVEVKTDGCTGCGVGQMYCPSEPRAIVVEPRE